LQIMKPIEEIGHVPMAIVIMGAFNGLFLSVNGIFMLIAPETWYESVPGVTGTGFFNQHFIRDIGIIQLFLRPERSIGLWLVATLWLGAHAVFHLWEVAVGICSPSALLRDFPAVSLPAILGANPDPVGDPPAARPPNCIRLIPGKILASPVVKHCEHLRLRVRRTTPRSRRLCGPGPRGAENGPGRPARRRRGR